MYAKIDDLGNVIEFPFKDISRNVVNKNIVEVDDITYKPSNLKWYQAAWYDVVEKIEEKYFIKYRIENKKFNDDEEKKQCFSYHIEMYRGKNKKRYEEQEITLEQYESNNVILDNINLNEEKCYDDVYKLIF